jgi:hypothetical protein
MDFAGFPNDKMKKKKKEEMLPVRIPASFLQAADLKVISEGFPNRNDYLRELANQLKPTIKELKKKGLLKDEEDFQ